MHRNQRPLSTTRPHKLISFPSCFICPCSFQCQHISHCIPHPSNSLSPTLIQAPVTQNIFPPSFHLQFGLLTCIYSLSSFVHFLHMFKPFKHTLNYLNHTLLSTTPFSLTLLLVISQTASHHILSLNILFTTNPPSSAHLHQ